MDAPAGRFGESALRLSGHAALLFGWPPATFWAATPAELAAILRVATGGGAAPGAPPSRELIDKMLAGDPDGPDA